MDRGKIGDESNIEEQWEDWNQQEKICLLSLEGATARYFVSFPLLEVLAPDGSVMVNYLLDSRDIIIAPQTTGTTRRRISKPTESLL